MLTDGERDILRELEEDARPRAGHTCTIEVDEGGYYIVANGDVLTFGLLTPGDAVEEAEAEGLTILNMDEVERWMQPPDDWGICEEEEPAQ